MTTINAKDIGVNLAEAKHLSSQLKNIAKQNEKTITLTAQETQATDQKPLQNGEQIIQKKKRHIKQFKRQSGMANL
jgi:GTP cyclohydrolase I